MVESVLVELSVVIIVALVITAGMRLLRQPSIVGYLIAGIVAGPLILDLIGDRSGFEPFAKIGISLLLFSVGLNLNPRAVKNLGKVVIVTGIGQMVFTFVAGYFVGLLLGFSSIASVYIALALAFSSTIIIMNLLSDREETETLHGRIAIGFLIVQDVIHIIVIIVLLAFSSIGSGAEIGSVISGTLYKFIALGAVLFFVSVYVLPNIMKLIARSQEMLLFFSLGWALALSALFQHEAINFSMEVGALISGVALSISPYKFEISSKLKPLKDFFLLIFFIWLAFLMSPINLREYAWQIAVFSLLALIGTPIIVMSLMGLLGYTKRNSFLTGIYVAQISEFSFIITALGVSLGHIQSEILSVVIGVGLITMAGSSYGITHSRGLYNILADYLNIFERKYARKVDEGKFHVRKDYDVVLFGYNRIGFDLLRSFRSLKKRVLVVDFNPETIMRLAKKGIDARYGDANDVELLEDLDFKKSKMIVSTIPEKETNLLLIRKLKKVNEELIFVVIAHHIDDALELYNAGASYVIMPHFLGGVHTANLISKHGLKRSAFAEEKERSRKELLRRKREGHRHPTHERG